MAKNNKNSNTEQQLKEDIKSGTFKRLYLLCGEEDYLKEYYVKQMQKKISPDKDEFSFAEFEAHDFSFERFEDEVSTVPFTGGQKLVIVRNLRFSHLKNTKDDFLKLLADLPDTAVVVLYYDGSVTAEQDYKKQTKLKEELKALSASGLFVELKVRAKSELKRWLIRHFAGEKLAYSQDVPDFMLLHCSNEMAALRGEFEKLALYAKGRTVTTEDVEAICSPSEQKVIFDLSNDIGAMRYSAAVATLTQLREQRFEAEKLAEQMGQVFAEMLYVKAAMQDGIVSAERVMKDFEIGSGRRFLVERYYTAVQRLETDYLMRCITLTEQTLAALRPLSEDERWLLLEKTVVELMRQ